MGGVGELNRHERGPTLGGLSYVDHRRIPFAPGDYGRAIEDLRELVPDARYRATAVHVLDAYGTVFTLAFEGTDTRGNELQWTRTCSWGFDEGRVEVYEDDDLDAALARFEELRPLKRRLENAATEVEERFQACFAARDWAAMARNTGRRHFRRRSSTGSERRDPTRSRCQNRGHAGDRRPRDQERDVDRDRHPRAAPRPGAYPPLGERPAARGISHRDARHHRDRR